MLENPVRQFYDEFASHYHLMFEDWEASMSRQATALNSILQQVAARSSGVRVLDCTCGIGTQSLGLAKIGYSVTGSDLSAGAVERARAEAGARSLNVPFYVADIRRLDELPIGVFDAVISMDNALPHLLSDPDILVAARQIHGKLRPNGTLIASIRDYDQLVRERPTVQGPAFFSDSEHRRITFQVWDWQDDRRYTFHHYITRETPSGWSNFHSAAVYRAILRQELTAILEFSGFANVRWLFPDESGFYQPIVIASATARV